MPIREQGQSQLDYLWVNYGKPLELNKILTIEQIQELVNGVSDSSVTNIQVINNQLVGYNQKGDKIFSINIQDINKTPISFSKRYITQEDIDTGCTYKKGTSVYSLLFSDGSELIVKIDEYQGEITNSINITVSNNTISGKLRIDNGTSVIPLKETNNGVVADLKISSDTESIEFTKELDGLKAKIILDNEGKSLKFKYLTLDNYLAIEDPDPTTVYFIQGKKYFYFGRYAIGNGETNLDDYYTKDEIDAKLELLDFQNIEELKLQTDKNTKDLLKLQGSSDQEGSILNIISNQINSALTWEEVN